MKGANSPWSCGDVVKRVDLRRGFCFVVARLRSRRRHGQYNCDSNWIGKNAAAAEREGKKGLERRMRRRLTQCAKEGRGAARSTAAEVCFLPRKFGMDHRNRPRAEKRQSISGSSSSEQNETELLQCFVGSLSEGAGSKALKREGGAHAIKVRSRYADDCCCFHSVPFFPAATQKRLTPSLSSFPFTTGLRQKGRTGERTDGEIHGAKNRLPKRRVGLGCRVFISLL